MPLAAAAACSPSLLAAPPPVARPPAGPPTRLPLQRPHLGCLSSAGAGAATTAAESVAAACTRQVRASSALWYVCSHRVSCRASAPHTKEVSGITPSVARARDGHSAVPRRRDAVRFGGFAVCACGPLRTCIVGWRTMVSRWGTWAQLELNNQLPDFPTPLRVHASKAAHAVGAPLHK